jgi:hypothetical protein
LGKFGFGNWATRKNQSTLQPCGTSCNRSVLHIADDYEFMNEELIEMLTDPINDTLKIIYNFQEQSRLLFSKNEDKRSIPFVHRAKIQ